MRMDKTKAKVTGRSLLAFIITLVLVTTGIIFALKLDDGIRKYEDTVFDISGTINTVCTSTDGKTVYFGMRDSKVIAVGEDGDIKWEFKTGDTILDLKTAGDYIYASSDDRKLYVIGQDGSSINEIEVGYRPLTITGSADGEIIAAGTKMSAMKNRLVVFNKEGERIYKEDLDETISEVFVHSDNNRVIYITQACEIISIDKDGNEISRNDLEYYPVSAVYSPEVDRIVVSDEGNNIYSFDGDLNLLWKKNTGVKINSVDNDYIKNRVIAACNDGFLMVLDENGNEIYRVNAETELRLVRVNSARGEAYALKSINDTFKTYKITELSNYTSKKKAATAVNIFLILSAFLLVVSIVNLIPGLGKKIWIRLLRICKLVFKYKLSYLMISPILIMLAIFNYYPSISGLVLAFTDYKPGVHMRWVGFDNFVRMIGNQYFWTGIGNMIILLVTDLLKGLVPAIIIAELILAMKSKAAQYWSRVALYIPAILPGVAVYLVWTSGILGIDGALNSLLNAVGLGRFAVSWLGEAKTAIWGLVFIGFPWVGSYIIFYGALIGIPGSLFEAAKLDGCSWIKRIISIDIPLIGAQMKYVFVMTFIASVQDFGRIFITTMGGPGRSTYTPMLELYFNMSKFKDYGMASAMGIFLFIIIFGATLMNLRLNLSADKN